MQTQNQGMFVSVSTCFVSKMYHLCSGCLKWNQAESGESVFDKSGENVVLYATWLN